MTNLKTIIVALAIAFSFIPYTLWCDFCNLSPSEFEYFAQVVEAESNRSMGCTDGKVYVATCIWDRVNSEYFPNTVQGVLDDPGQFTTTSGGMCSTRATNGSRLAVMVSYILLKKDMLPTNLLYFNCIGYQYGTSYAKIGDNYFSTYGSPVDFNL